MGQVETRPWDVTDYLQGDEDIVAYLKAALEDSDRAHVAAALVNIARAREAMEELEGCLRLQIATREVAKSPTRMLPTPSSLSAGERFVMEPVSAIP